MKKTALFAGATTFGLLAALAGTSGVARADDAPASASEANQVKEVIVTAQKRSENLKDVPIPVTAVNGDSLISTGQTTFEDYYSNIPGLNLSNGLYGTYTLTIRGLNTDAGNPTVGTVIDDLSTGSGGWSWVPDLDPDDLAQVEVLRGPQGTLYGADSMGGLVKFVTKDPNPSAFTAQVSAGLSSVTNGDTPGYNVRGSMNIPINDSLAVRVSGYEREDPGYIDNTTYHLNDVNRTENDGGHFALRWIISPDTSLKLNALYQQTRPNAPSEVTAASGALETNYMPNVRGFQSHIGMYSMNFSTKFDGITLTSITGYVLADRTGTLDWTNLYGPSFQQQFGVSGAKWSNHFATSTFTQETRLSGTLFHRLDWLVGGYYTNQVDRNAQIFRAYDPVTLKLVAIDGNFNYPDNYESTAGFANLTYHVTHKFDIQVGGRFSHDVLHNDASYSSGPFNGNVVSISAPTTASSDTFTYLVSPRYVFSPDLMVYARVATGFRPGAANQAVLQGQVVPPQSNPDSTESYEVGLKGDFLNHRLFIDTSLYHVDWKNIQIAVQTQAAYGYLTNGSGAKSDGVEFSATLKPRQGMQIGGWVDFNNAVLTQNFPADASAFGVAGNRLPEGSRLSGNLSLDQDFPLWDGATGSVGGRVSYIGDRLAAFNNLPITTRQDFPAYTKVDLHSTVSYGTWKFNLYVNNVADERGQIGANGLVPGSLIYITPRTVGLNVAKRF